MARTFDGVNDHTEHGDNVRIDKDDPQTIVYAVRLPDTTSEAKFIIAKQDNFVDGIGWNSVVSTSGTVGMTVRDNGVGQKTRNSTTAVDDDNWHIVVITIDATINRSGINMSIDGSSETMIDGADTLVNSSLAPEPLRIACREGCTFSELAGEVANYAHYGREFPVASAQALSRGVNPFAFGTMRIFCPLAGDKSPEPDISGNDLDGTLTGTTKFAGNPPVELIENYL